jgi:hypothetical protein
MSTYLLVTNQTAESPAFRHAIDSVIDADNGAEFVLLVPATPDEFLPVHDAGSARDVARQITGQIAQSLERAGYHLKWSVVADQAPVVALETELRDHPGAYAGVIFVSPPSDRGHWLDHYLRCLTESRELLLVHVVDDAGAPEFLTDYIGGASASDRFLTSGAWA